MLDPVQPLEYETGLFGIFLSRKAKKKITNSNDASTIGLGAFLVPECFVMP